MPRMLRSAIEILAVIAIVAWTTLIGVPRSVDAALERSLTRTPAATPVAIEDSDLADPVAADPDADARSVADAESVAGDGVMRAAHDVGALARRSSMVWAGGILALLVGRFVALRGRRRRHIRVPLLVPSIAWMSGFGLILHWAYQDVRLADTLRAPVFAQGVLLGGLAAAALMIVPVDPARWIRRFAGTLALVAVALLVALYFFGETPGASGARVRLFGFQPIEAVKLIFVALVATLFGRRSEQLRYHRERWRGFVRVPRPKEVLPAVLLLAVLFLGLYLVRDFGPTLILVLAFLALYYAVTRSWVEWALLIALGGVSFALAIGPFAAYLPSNVATRVGMMRDPWLNGELGGDQLAASLWSLAAGGLRGRGLGQAEVGALPAGHTDLILAHLAEVLGLIGVTVYLAALLALVLQACWIGRQNRTPERMLLACGLGALVFAQLAVIFAGTTGWVPLTGIVVPFLSFGRTSMVVFMLVAALLVRLAADGRPVRQEKALIELGSGVSRTALAIVAITAGMFLVAADRTVFSRGEIMRQGVLAIGFDDAVFLRYDPRLRAIANRIARGPILDRHGEPLAVTGADGTRSHPIGAAMGTLIGVLDPAIGATPWALEHAHGPRLRGLAEIEQPLGVWIERRPDRLDRILFTVEESMVTAADEARARRLQSAGTTLLFSRLENLDLSPLVPLARKRGAARERAIATMSADIESRTVRITVDRALQVAAAEAVERVVEGRAPAGAAAVIDVASGEVLARAQWPDIDPGRRGRWREKVIGADPAFIGSYGPWKDKTGIAGLYQTGSIFKIFTALASVRAGLDYESFGAQRCAIRGRETFGCVARDGEGPMFGLPGWVAPIHDSHWQLDGNLDVTEALAVSCNVFFAQLGLHLGPEALVRLAEDGLEVDSGRPFDPGAPGSRRLASTAFGQGAARMHVLEAARLAAVVAGGGVYRRCPPDLELGAECQTRTLVDDPDRLAPVLAGMRRTLTHERGTARRLRAPEGTRLYAKTGTATDVGRIDEIAYGFAPGEEHEEHSWMIAIAEPVTNPECATEAPGRLAFAAVVPRGGAGSGAALDIIQRLVDAAADRGLLGDSPSAP